MSPWQLLRISVLWFGIQFFWFSQQLVVMPVRIEHFVPAGQIGFYTGLIRSSGAVMVLLTQLSIGFLSDHAWSRLGRRRPFIIAGLSGGLVAITLFMLAPTYWWMYATYLVLELSLNTTAVSFQSLLPDLVPPRQHAQAGSYMGLLDLGGTLFGCFSVIAMSVLFGQHGTGFTSFLLPLYLAVLGGLGLLTIFGVDEVRWQVHSQRLLAGAVRELRLLPGTVVRYAAGRGGVFSAMLRDYLSIDLRELPDFFWLAVSRFAIYFSYQTFTFILYYYVEHNLDWQGFLIQLGTTPAAAQHLGPMAVLSGMLIFFLLGGLSGSLLAAPAARTQGKKRVIAVGLCITTLMSVPLILAHSVWLAIGAGLVLGIGWGAFLASDWAFACNLMPAGRAGSFMGLWAITSLFPQVLAPVVGGRVLDAVYNGQLPHLGEAGAWQLAVRWVLTTMLLYFVLGLVLLRNVRDDKPTAVMAKAV